MKQVMISELKAHLSEVLRAVKAGETYVVRDRGVPVAQVVPYVEEDEIDIIEPTLPPSALKDWGGREPSIAWLAVETLLRMRDEEDY